MKKVFLVLALIASGLGVVKAQVSEKAFGLRFVYSAEFSYLHPIGKTNRLEFDLGMNSFGEDSKGSLARGTALSGVYQWVWDLSDLAEGFNWYVGVGGALLSHESHFGAGALAQLGVEYRFSFPLQLSLDYRPALFFLSTTDKATRASFVGPCLSARFCFK